MEEQRAKARKEKEDYMKGYSKIKVDLELKEKELEVEITKNKVASKCCNLF